MASKRMDLSQRCYFVLSGVSNELGKTLGLEMCRRFKPGSIAVLIDDCGENLQELRKEIQFLENDVQVICWNIGDWQQVDAAFFRNILKATLKDFEANYFDFAFVLHNEGTLATQRLMEPDLAENWQKFVQEHLYAAVALNQEFLKAAQLSGTEKLVVNMTSSLMVKPFVYSSLMCSCLKARDMYFRAMAAEESRNQVAVLTYSPGVLASHKPEYDMNNNTVDLLDLEQSDSIMLKLPRVKPLRATLKLINILQEISFISGHDVDYYDTFVL